MHVLRNHIIYTSLRDCTSCKTAHLALVVQLLFAFTVAAEARQCREATAILLRNDCVAKDTFVTTGAVENRGRLYVCKRFVAHSQVTTTGGQPVRPPALIQVLHQAVQLCDAPLHFKGGTAFPSLFTGTGVWITLAVTERRVCTTETAPRCSTSKAYRDTGQTFLMSCGEAYSFA